MFIFRTCFFLLFSGIPFLQHAQYILNGSATQDNCNCYTLTQAVNWQGGSVWNANKINLSNSFDFTFNVFLGCQDANGADGIVFILQPISTSLGSGGGGMGFEGISPSIGIALDTWQNTNNNDPAFDHVSIQANGVITHGADLQGPVQASASGPDIEDCQWHTFRIEWNAQANLLNVHFDGQFRLAYNGNIVATIFNNDPWVFWGFTGATGGANNLQKFCTSLNPAFNSNLNNNAACFGTPVVFSDTSVSFAPIQSWYWDFGDGTFSNLQNPPPHNYAAPGVYEVKLVITGMDGCVSDTLRQNITIGSKPVADFQVSDTCYGFSPGIMNNSSNQVGTITEWTWILNGTVVSGAQQPQLSNLPAGNYNLNLVVKSVYGCASDTATGTFVIKPAPAVDFTVPGICINEPVNFSSFQTDNLTSISSWSWDFGDGNTSSVQNPVHLYTVPGMKLIRLTATATNGCRSATVVRSENVVFVSVTTLNDSTILPNIPLQMVTSFQSNSAGMISFTWSPSSGLNNPFIQNPAAILTDDKTYLVTASTAEGCTDTDTVNLNVFKGSAIYVPSGFTPNGDGRNDVLRPIYLGVTKVYFFRVYNRWGQLVFSSSTPGEGWDGKINGVPQSAGTYVWMLKAEDLAGKVYEMKGTSTIVR